MPEQTCFTATVSPVVQFLHDIPKASMVGAHENGESASWTYNALNTLTRLYRVSAGMEVLPQPLQAHNAKCALANRIAQLVDEVDVSAR